MFHKTNDKTKSLFREIKYFEINFVPMTPMETKCCCNLSRLEKSSREIFRFNFIRIFNHETCNEFD